MAAMAGLERPLVGGHEPASSSSSMASWTVANALMSIALKMPLTSTVHRRALPHGRISTVHRIDCRASPKKYCASGQFFFWTANHRLAQWYPTSIIVWDCVGTTPSGGRRRRRRSRRGGRLCRPRARTGQPVLDRHPADDGPEHERDEYRWSADGTCVLWRWLGRLVRVHITAVSLLCDSDLT